MLSYIEYQGRFPSLNEVSQQTFDKISDRLDIAPEKMALNNMFKGKMRIALPLNTKEWQGLEQALEVNGFKVDFRQGTASKEVIEKAGPREGQKKLQQFKIGKAVEVLVKQKAIDEKWWTYWNKTGGSLIKQAQENPELFETDPEKQLSVIISRSPVDLLRMSDFEKIRSCHSEGGDYFMCAISEAKQGGAIAFTVKTSDLKNVNLQDKEIFADSSRGVKGIKPLNRVRLRLFANDKMQLGLPEKRVYGADIPGFRKEVMNWAREALKDTLQGERPRMKDFKLHGGSYEDNMASHLFNDFFDDELDRGGVGRGFGKGEDDEEAQAEAHNQAMRDEIERFEQRYNNFEHKQVAAYYNEADEMNNGQIEFHWYGSVEFEFPQSQWDNKAFAKTTGWKLMKELKRSYSVHFEDIDVSSDETSFGGRTDGKVIVHCSVDDENSPGHPDGYRDFLRTMKSDYDDNYTTTYAELRSVLLKNNILKPDSKDKLIKIIQSEKFENFEFNEDPYDSSSNQDTLNITSMSTPLFTRKQIGMATDIDVSSKGAGNNNAIDYLTKSAGGWATQQQGNKYWPGMKTEMGESSRSKFGLIQQAAMQKVKEWWGRVKHGYESQPYLPGFEKPPFKDRMSQIIEPRLHFAWGREGEYVDQTLKVELSWQFDWEMDGMTVIGTLRGIRFMDKNFDRIIDEIRHAIYDVITKEHMRVQQYDREQEELRAKERRNPLAGNPHFNHIDNFKTFVNPGQQAGQNPPDEQQPGR